MKEGCLVELRNNLILLKIASTHMNVGSFSKSPSAVKNTTYGKKGIKEKISKTSPFCRQTSPCDLHHYESPENRRKHKVNSFPGKKSVSKAASKQNKC